MVVSFFSFHFKFHSNSFCFLIMGLGIIVKKHCCFSGQISHTQFADNINLYVRLAEDSQSYNILLFIQFQLWCHGLVQTMCLSMIYCTLQPGRDRGSCAKDELEIDDFETDVFVNDFFVFLLIFQAISAMFSSQKLIIQKVLLEIYCIEKPNHSEINHNIEPYILKYTCIFIYITIKGILVQLINLLLSM